VMRFTESAFSDSFQTRALNSLLNYCVFASRTHWTPTRMHLIASQAVAADNLRSHRLESMLDGTDRRMAARAS
jgi:hypothetical protein